MLAGLVLAVGVSNYANKDIKLSKEEVTALATKNLTNYQIKDSLVSINGEERTSRCLIKNNKNFKCFNVKNGILTQEQITLKLNEIELKEIKKIAKQIKDKPKTPVLIGEGNTTISEL